MGDIASNGILTDGESTAFMYLTTNGRKIALAQLIDGACEAEDFFPAFGEAVYAAKRRGKNCVVEV